MKKIVISLVIVAITILMTGCIVKKITMIY
jgi:hypothetical protein